MPALTAMVVLKGHRIKAMGSIMALMTMAHSLGMFSGAMMGGMMMDFFQLQTAFPLGGGVMLISTGLFLACTHPGKN
jgi:predicted MFS family arabinose efflux permease